MSNVALPPPPSPPPPNAPSRWGAAFAAWSAMLGLTWVVLLVAYLMRDALPGSALAWAAMLALVQLGVVLARRAFAERAVLLASLLALMAAAPIACGAADALAKTIVTAREWGPAGEYSGQLGYFWAPVALLFSVIVVPFVAFPLAWRRLRGLGAVMRALAWAAIASALALSVAAGVRGLHRPPPDGYVASLRLLATLPNDPHAAVNGDHVHLARREGPDCAFDVYLTEKDGRVLDQVFTSGALSSCGKIGIRHDDVADLWIFTNEDAMTPSPLLAVTSYDHGNVVIDVPRVAGELSAPRAWIALAVLGALAAAAWIVHGARLLRPLRERTRAVEATHLGGGSVRLGDDAPPFVVDRAAALPAGPVLLLGTTDTAAGAYRSSGVPLAPREVVEGTRAAAEEALASAVASHHAYAFVCAATAAIPLAVAAFQHLVF